MDWASWFDMFQGVEQVVLTSSEFASRHRCSARMGQRHSGARFAGNCCYKHSGGLEDAACHGGQASDGHRGATKGSL